MNNLIVVNISSTYNTIIHQPILNRIHATRSTYHMMMKFATNTSVGELRSNSRESRQCYLTTVSLPKKVRPEGPPMDLRNFVKSLSHPELIETLIETPLDKARLNRVIKMGTMLPNKKRVQLINFLKKNDKVFVWSPRNMLGINPNVAQHWLNISPITRLVEQMPYKFALKHQ